MNIAAAFNGASEYERYASLQRKVASELARKIVDQPLPACPEVLEIGCGTGLLGAAMIDRFPGAQWLMTDIAPAMVERTSRRFAFHPRVTTRVMDGENPEGDLHYDLICSSLAMQWFRDLPSALKRLRGRLAPGGLLAFTTLVEGTFAEWRTACACEAPGTPDYLAPVALEALDLDVTVERHTVSYRDARAFVHALKKIGAGTPRPGYRPLSPAAFRRVMARFEATGAIATYAVATCMARAAPTP